MIGLLTYCCYFSYSEMYSSVCKPKTFCSASGFSRRYVPEKHLPSLPFGDALPEKKG